MNRIDLQSQHGRVPPTDGRSAESRMLKAVRAELVAQIGDRPTVSQRLLIDRVAQVSLQIHLMDQRKVQATRREYLDATRLLAELLAQLQPTASVSPIMPAASHCEAAA